MKLDETLERDECLARDLFQLIQPPLNKPVTLQGTCRVQVFHQCLAHDAFSRGQRVRQPSRRLQRTFSSAVYEI